MKRTIWILTGLQCLIFLAIAVTSSGVSSDPAGTAMSDAFLLLGGLALVVFLLPAMILAGSPRFEKLALILAMVPPGLAMIFSETLF